MNISSAAILLGLSAPANADFNGLRRLSRSRELQNCDGLASKTCRQTGGCTWSAGQCISTTPTGTPAPTKEPTPAPTDSPLPAGVGVCSDDSGRQCVAVADCVCGGGSASASAVAASIFKRRRAAWVADHDRALQACDPNAQCKDCPAGCVWLNGGCAYPEPNLQVCDPNAQRKDCPEGCIWLGGNGGCASPSPTKMPTLAPTPCSCLGAPTPSPAPTPEPTTGPDTDATYVPGDLTVLCDGGNLLVSTGMDCKLLTTDGDTVLLADGSRSTATMHPRADGATVIQHPTDGGWYYVSNSETGNGGVGTLRFDSSGDLIGYERQLSGTSDNCGGGRTPWNTWVSCEEDGSSGFCHEVDPFTGFTQQVNVVSTGGNYESFAYDDQDPTAPSGTRYFVTEDSSDGALTRYTPAAGAYSTGNDYDILSSSGGTYEYLILSNDGTFSWTPSLSAGRDNAADIFPQSEGIDVHDRILSFVAKSIQKLFTLDLEAGTWSESSTLSGAFNLQPDQLGRIVGDGDVLYFCEDGGNACDIHGRDTTGQYFTIVEGRRYRTETTGLAFSPDGMYMYVAFQADSNVYSFWRTDGLPFNGRVADTKYHSA